MSSVSLRDASVGGYFSSLLGKDDDDSSLSLEKLKIDDGKPTDESKKKGEVQDEKKKESTDEKHVKTTVATKKLFFVKNAHQDDIHNLIKLSNGIMVSGSKDGALKMWTKAGKLQKVVYQPDGIDYTQWITALAPAGGDMWISGTRDGQYVDLWDKAGEKVSGLFPQRVFYKEDHKCKERNAKRINCLTTAVFAGELQYYVGWPTQFTMHNIKQKERLGHCVTSHNDWVFCIHPLSQRKFMVVTGADLDIWDMLQKAPYWRKTSLIAEQKPKELSDRLSRPFISDMKPLESYPSTFALAVFGGTVRVIDIIGRKDIRVYREHGTAPKKNRVWTVENIAPHVIASCSDDHTIKLWDVRTSASVSTLTGNIGRVSTLCYLGENILVSGACPDNLRTSKERAQLTYWDIRTL